MNELEVSVEQAARRLLGSELVRRFDDVTTARVRIIETEAYNQTDAASHSYKGRTPRTDVMFGPPGRLYVYFTYGMHYCCNVVTGSDGEGSAVLIRAVEPLEGTERLEQNRGRTGKDALNGPAKLCQALMIDRGFNGHDLSKEPVRLLLQSPLPSSRIVATTRVGIRQAREKKWRFYVAGSPFVSVI